MTRIVFVVAFLFASGSVQGQERFVLPNDTGDIPPVGYLEKMDVGDTTRQLSEPEKHKLCRMFIRAAIITTHKYPELDQLKAQTPVYLLFKSNFPDIAAKEDSEGHAVSLTMMVRYINRLPEYRPDVIQLLQGSLDRAHHCTSNTSGQHKLGN